MYAFVLELSSRDEKSVTGSNWITRVEEEYSERLSGRKVVVTRSAQGRYRVSFDREDYNFNWCFAVSDGLKLEAIELTIPNIVIPSTKADRLQPHANGFFHAFPDATRFPGLYCELVIDPRRCFITVRTEIGEEYPRDEYRSGMFTVVHGVMHLGRMAKWANRLIHAHEEKNYGKADRAATSLRKAIARSAPFIVLP